MRRPQPLGYESGLHMGLWLGGCLTLAAEFLGYLASFSF